MGVKRFAFQHTILRYEHFGTIKNPDVKRGSRGLGKSFTIQNALYSSIQAPVHHCASSPGRNPVPAPGRHRKFSKKKHGDWTLVLSATAIDRVPARPAGGGGGGGTAAT